MGFPPSRDPSVVALTSDRAIECPFHDGPQTLDLLLADLRHGAPGLVDLALELRSAMTARADADRCIDLLLTLRARLDGRHHLAFYRVRTWLRRNIVAEVRPDRATPWRTCDLPLDCARYDELMNRCLATLVEHEHGWPPTATFRLRFTTAAP
ncbi:MAG: hypothetical protein IPL39_22160 [Opitutaceae bacterium]|nr:hypothetical protein [Opitutaceae bacterium]